jgi:hypothetical protein
MPVSRRSRLVTDLLTYAGVAAAAPGRTMYQVSPWQAQSIRPLAEAPSEPVAMPITEELLGRVAQRPLGGWRGTVGHGRRRRQVRERRGQRAGRQRVQREGKPRPTLVRAGPRRPGGRRQAQGGRRERYLRWLGAPLAEESERSRYTSTSGTARPL